MKPDLIITGRYILPIQDDMGVIENGAIVVRGDKIIYVGDKNGALQIAPDHELLETGNSIIMPGLINCHTHAAMSYFRGMADDLPLDEWLNDHIWPAEAKNVNPAFVKNATKLSCEEMLRSGTTCFNDMYFFEDQVAETALAAGMRACIGEGMLDFPTPSCDNILKSVEKTAALIEKYRDHELIKVNLAPHSIYTCGKEGLVLAGELAEKHNCRIHIHISETKKENDDCYQARNLSPVQYLNSYNLLSGEIIAAHSVWLDGQDLKIYADRKVNVAHCPISNMKLASGAAPIKQMLEMGINVGLGTDGPASNNTQDLFMEMRVTALLHKLINSDPTAVGAKTVVRMATINGARLLGLDKDIGTLEVGKKADIITIGLDKPHLTPIFDPYSHLVYAVKGSDVDNVIINGNIVMENQKLRNERK